MRKRCSEQVQIFGTWGVYEAGEAVSELCPRCSVSSRIVAGSERLIKRSQPGNSRLHASSEAATLPWLYEIGRLSPKAIVRRPLSVLDDEPGL